MGQSSSKAKKAAKDSPVKAALVEEPVVQADVKAENLENKAPNGASAAATETKTEAVAENGKAENGKEENKSESDNLTRERKTNWKAEKNGKRKTGTVELWKIICVFVFEPGAWVVLFDTKESAR